jgi:hypothetical protein
MWKSGLLEALRFVLESTIPVIFQRVGRHEGNVSWLTHRVRGLGMI